MSCETPTEQTLPPTSVYVNLNTTTLSPSARTLCEFDDMRLLKEEFLGC